MSLNVTGKRCRSLIVDSNPTFKSMESLNGFHLSLGDDAAGIAPTTNYSDHKSDDDNLYVTHVPGIPPKTVELNPDLFQDNALSLGGYVKGRRMVIREYSKSIRRPPNMNCRVESFGRICQKFDERKTRWVGEMGFGGLLHLAKGMHLPRQLSYWLMTRIDPISRVLIGTDGRVFPFSKNQVSWVLGIPCGPKVVPSTKDMSDVVREKVQSILLKYGRTWETKPAKEMGRSYTSVGIPVTTSMMDKLESHFEDDQEEEFKTLFLIIAIQMILCPTQSPRLPHDLLPAIGCAMESIEFDWCELVLAKLMDNVTSFARRFYANGFAGGCGGCAIFVVLFYLDRLNWEPVNWDTYPRIKAWDMKQIGIAAKRDRFKSGDYGKLGLLDVAYGERHPRQARDTIAPPDQFFYHDVSKQVVCTRDRRRRGDLRSNRGSCMCFYANVEPSKVEVEEPVNSTCNALH